MGIQAKLKRVGSKFELYVGKTLKGVFGSVGAATSYLKKEFGKAFVPAPKGAKNPKPVATYAIAHAAARDAGNRNMRKGRRTSWNREDYNVAVKMFQKLYTDPLLAAGGKAPKKNPWHGGTQPARGKDYVGPKSGWVQVYKGSPINAKALANHLERSHNIPAKTVKSGIMSTVKVKLANISAAKRVVQDFKSELGAQGRKNPRCKVGRRRNVAMGVTVGKGKNRRFMPFRSSPDYDPSRLHDAEGQRARSKARKRAKGGAKKSKSRKAAPVRKGSKRSSMSRYRATQNPSAKVLMEMIKPGTRVTILTPQGQQRTGKAVMSGPSGWVLNMGGRHGTPGIANEGNIIKVGKYSFTFAGKRMSNPGKRKIPAAFKAAAERAKAMTPAQRAAWAKKMAAAKAAKRRGR